MDEFTQLKLLNDDETPQSFVETLLQDVFGHPPVAAKMIAAAVRYYGEADCGVWPTKIANAMSVEAESRIAAAGHPLSFARITQKGRDIVGQENCGFCGKPAKQVKLLYQGQGAQICDECLVRGVAKMSGSLRDTTFTHAHEILKWHFVDIGRDRIVTSVRNFPIRTRPDLQLALDEVFDGPTVKMIGVKAGYSYQSSEFSDLWETDRNAKSIVPIQYTDIDIGDDHPRRCIGTVLWLLETNNIKHAVLVSQNEGVRGDKTIRIEIATPEGTAGSDLSAQYFRKIDAIVNNAQSYRGKVLSLEDTQVWQEVSGAIMVHRLPTVSEDDVILPETTKTLLTRNVIEFAKLRDNLRAMGQATKKGLLFYGPPGTGKTHTIQYLAGALPNHTTLLVTAGQVTHLSEYFGLARLLQPAILVIEDADLIARDREAMGSPGEEALLNKLLNEMDGLRPDADIFFILTTNRPEHLEAALASRPGRIDQAIEFPLPDETGRQKLIKLYAGTLSLPPEIFTKTVTRTEGVSAAFIKELMRRIAQYVHERDPQTTTVTSPDIDAALDEMLFGGGSLNAAILGASSND